MGLFRPQACWLDSLPPPRAFPSKFSMWQRVLWPLFAAQLAPRLALAGTDAAGLQYLQENAKKDGVSVTKSGLQYRVLKSGPADGPHPNKSSPCEVHYAGRLLDGT